MTPQEMRLRDQAGMPEAALRAAQYVRMSTEHQKYSTENQAAAIGVYAVERGLLVVRTYADEGKSGLRLEGRHALKQLIADVQRRQTDYDVILVYDVSRWGRFQDADESAYYEFICKEAGIAVHYCAEQFENDGSMSATIMKNMKRAMAGEYSRELSSKTFQGQCRLSLLGFRQGGSAGYGLRRQLLDEHGTVKGILTFGQQKNLLSDRVILIPGPAHEVETVRRIFRLFVLEKKWETAISKILNSEGLPNEFGRLWNRSIIHGILTNEKYLGHNLFAKTCLRLKQKRVRNPPEMWLRVDRAFEPIVDIEHFEAAGRIIEERKGLSDEHLLERLTWLLNKTGKLSYKIIDQYPEVPASSVYRKRFKGLLGAFDRIGYVPKRNFAYVKTGRAFGNVLAEVVREAIASIELASGESCASADADLLKVNDEFTVAFTLSRCFATGAGYARWWVRINERLKADLTIVIRMAESNKSIRDYYIFPRIDIPANKFKLAKDNPLSLDAYRHDTLELFYALCARIHQRSLLGRKVHRTAATIPDFAPKTIAKYHVRSHREELERQDRLMAKAPLIRNRLLSVTNSLRMLFYNESFSTLLRAEAADSVPTPLIERIMHDQPKLAEYDRVPDGKHRTTVDPSYGTDVLNFVVISRYLATLFANLRLRQHLKHHYPTILSELESSISVSSLDNLALEDAQYPEHSGTAISP
jgi:DNA invertase Pin-like site-specific DNA recombinase